MTSGDGILSLRVELIALLESLKVWGIEMPRLNQDEFMAELCKHHKIKITGAGEITDSPEYTVLAGPNKPSQADKILDLLKHLDLPKRKMIEKADKTMVRHNGRPKALVWWGGGEHDVYADELDRFLDVIASAGPDAVIGVPPWVERIQYFGDDLPQFTEIRHTRFKGSYGRCDCGAHLFRVGDKRECAICGEEKDHG